ncbi:hypothetical protein D3C78_1233840 [compost metagenome]
MCCLTADRRELLQKRPGDLAQVHGLQQLLPLFQQPKSQSVFPRFLVLLHIAMRLKRLDQRVSRALMQSHTRGDLCNFQFLCCLVEQLQDKKRPLHGLYDRHATFNHLRPIPLFIRANVYVSTLILVILPVPGIPAGTCPSIS